MKPKASSDLHLPVDLGSLWLNPFCKTFINFHGLTYENFSITKNDLRPPQVNPLHFDYTIYLYPNHNTVVPLKLEKLFYWDKTLCNK